MILILIRTSSSLSHNSHSKYKFHTYCSLLLQIKASLMQYALSSCSYVNADKHSPASSARSTKRRVRGLRMSALLVLSYHVCSSMPTRKTLPVSYPCIYKGTPYTSFYTHVQTPCRLHLPPLFAIIVPCFHPSHFRSQKGYSS